MDPMPAARIAVLLGASLCACSTPTPAPVEVPWQEQAWADLAEAKAQVAENVEDRVVVFPGHGEITVHDWDLEGYPGNTWVRASFTYENTTGRELEWVRVWITVMNGEGRPIARQTTELFMPLGLPFNPGTLFADELRAPTRDAERDDAGWRWALGCEAVFADGEPPRSAYPGEAWTVPPDRYSGWIRGW